MTQPTQSISILAGPILGFITACLTLAAQKGIIYFDIIPNINIYLLDKKLERAMEKGNKKKVKELGKLLPSLKLYSSKKNYQGTAIYQIAQSLDEDSFTVLVNRPDCKCSLSDPSSPPSHHNISLVDVAEMPRG